MNIARDILTGLKVDVEFERAPKRARVGPPSSGSSSGSSSGEEPTMVIELHAGVQVTVPKDMLSCCVCHESLPTAYAHMNCNHNMCRNCVEKIISRRTIKCPVCRQCTKGISKLPILDIVLKVAPRTQACGEVVAGWKAEEEHVKNCVKCLEIKLKEYQDENKSLKKANEGLMKVNALKENEIDALNIKIENLKEHLPIGVILRELDSDSDDEEDSEATTVDLNSD